MDEQFTPQEQALIDRLQRAPQPRLSPTQVEAIQTQVLAAMDAPIPKSRPRPSIPMRVSAVAVAAATIILVFLLIEQQSRPQLAPTIQTLVLNGTAASTNTATLPVEATARQITAIAQLPDATKHTVPPGAATETPAPVPTEDATLGPETSAKSPTTPNVFPSVTPRATVAPSLAQATQQSTAAGTVVPTTSAAQLSGSIVVVEGPVRDIHANLVTIYDFKIQLQPDDPMLTILNVGDSARVKGNLDERGVLIAAAVSNTVGLAVGGGSALINGRVQTINGNLLTINGITLALSANDPRLKTIRVGNFLSVTGNFERQGSILVLVIVNIVVVHDADVQSYLECLKQRGMGMGDAAMGMGAPAPPPPAMGMGDDGMGMGAPGMGSPGCP